MTIPEALEQIREAVGGFLPLSHELDGASEAEVVRRVLTTLVADADQGMKKE